MSLCDELMMIIREDDLVEVPLEALQQLTVSLNDLQGKVADLSRSSSSLVSSSFLLLAHLLDQVKSLSDRVRTAECAFLGKKI